MQTIIWPRRPPVWRPSDVSFGPPGPIPALVDGLRTRRAAMIRATSRILLPHQGILHREGTVTAGSP
ncbi:hypothetical protein ACWD8I_25620, partial [Micromonospora arida]